MIDSRFRGLSSAKYRQYVEIANVKAGVRAIQNKDLARWFVQNRYKPNGFGGGMAPRVPLRPFVTPKTLYLM